MSRFKQLITVIHRRTVWQVLLVYIGVSWGVLEATSLFIEQFGLPQWAFPAAVLLLVIGLIILLATAWMQVQPAAQAPDAPTPWEVDLVNLKESVASGRLPHLTWARAILGGVFAFSLLFGFAGLYVLLSGPPRAMPVGGASDGDAAPGIAVLPFHVVGSPELELWREGMVDLLSTNLDGAAGLRMDQPLPRPYCRILQRLRGRGRPGGSTGGRERGDVGPPRLQVRHRGRRGGAAGR